MDYDFIRVSEASKKDQEYYIDELYNTSAITIEGLIEDSIPDFVNWLEEQNVEPSMGLVYIIKGETMNSLYFLKGEDKYPDNLTIVSIPFEPIDKDKPCSLITKRFEVGARWFDDIVDNIMANTK